MRARKRDGGGFLELKVHVRRVEQDKLLNKDHSNLDWQTCVFVKYFDKTGRRLSVQSFREWTSTKRTKGFKNAIWKIVQFVPIAGKFVVFKIPDWSRKTLQLPARKDTFFVKRANVFRD